MDHVRQGKEDNDLDASSEEGAEVDVAVINHGESVQQGHHRLKDALRGAKPQEDRVT